MEDPDHITKVVGVEYIARERFAGSGPCAGSKLGATTSPAERSIRSLHMFDQKSIAPMSDLMVEAKRAATSVSILITARITLMMVFCLVLRKVISLLAEDRF
jgi:hypothetical protein